MIAVMKRKRSFAIGDVVTIKRIPSSIKDLPVETQRVFNLCIGKSYPVQEIDRCGHLELEVGNDVDKKVGGFMNTIWIEPEFVESVKK